MSFNCEVVCNTTKKDISIKKSFAFKKIYDKQPNPQRFMIK